MTADQARLIIAWADNAAVQIRAIDSADNLVDWIIAERWRLHDLEIFAFARCSALRVSIAKRFEELEA